MKEMKVQSVLEKERSMAQNLSENYKCFIQNCFVLYKNKVA